MAERQALFSEWMGSALDCAGEAAARGDIPIGAVVANADGRVVAAAGNRREIDGDPTAHAEILALRSAAEEIGDWRL
ncbi:MAG: nucleoside deaminase, partial [Actinomycetales bacterium]|nr:nucleoside deaminase [Actinomycetales bacterium]